MTIRLSSFIRALTAVMPVVTAACFSLEEAGSGDHVGAIGFNLTLPADMQSEDLSYTIVGPGTYQKVGKVTLGAQDRTFSALINNIPVGSGYQLQLASGTNDTKVRCMGASAFAIAPQETTRVDVNVQCRIKRDQAPVQDPDPTPAPDAGSGEPEVDDHDNMCPDIDGLYTWREANGTYEFSSSACDPDSSPAPLRYKWTVSGGELSSTDDDVVRFVCPQNGGDVQVKLEVSDSLCSVAKTAKVNCDCDTQNQRR